MVLQLDDAFLQSLFSGLDGGITNQSNDDDHDDHDDDDETRLQRQSDLAQFLKEFCIFSQTLAPHGRDNFFKVALQCSLVTKADGWLVTSTKLSYVEPG